MILAALIILWIQSALSISAPWWIWAWWWFVFIGGMLVDD